MRKALIYIVLLLSCISLSAQEGDTVAAVSPADTLEVPRGGIIAMRGAFLAPGVQRDSILIGDQLMYGVELRLVEEGTRFALPEWKNDPKGGVMAVSPWIVDTVKVTKQKKGLPKLMDIKAGLVITSFDEGLYDLPQIILQRHSKEGVVDTLYFEPMRVEFKTMPVDTATFVPHDIKGQIRYPVTAGEIIPWVIGGQWIVALIILAICLYLMFGRKEKIEFKRKDPAHIVALRELDKYRGKDMWVPEKQKAFYSGVTDALREYIAERYGIGAMEMTTSEIFDDMKKTDAPAELIAEVKELFERADFVKFAKFTASDEDNAKALPVAVRFVTQTYQIEVEEISPLPSVGRNDSGELGRNDSGEVGRNDRGEVGRNDSGEV